MIKFALIFIFFLSSCSGIALNRDTYDSLKSLFFKEEVVLNTDINFSYIKAELKGNSAILVLAYVENDIYEWVGLDETRIYTFNGKVIKTVGLMNDITINNFARDTESFLISFTNPEVYFLSASYKLINSMNSNKKIYLLDIHDLNLSKKDIYHYADSRLLKTRQYLNPQLGYINIEFNL
tara:strand:+ start:26 stop:565 length:540 start_codon:yes stop_codon:yes gene_type:complete